MVMAYLSVQLFLSWATLRDAATLSASNACQGWIGGKATSVTILATLTANLRVKLSTIFSFICSGGLDATSFRTRHFHVLSAHQLT